MKKNRARLLLHVLFLTSLHVSADTLVLRDVNIVDVERGIVLEHRALTIRSGRIAAITTGRGEPPPDDAKVLDYRGKYLIPGLWDMHFHPETTADLELMVINGVLGARSLMGEARHLQWRAEIALGQRTGPRLLLAGPIVEGHPPEGMADLITTSGRRLLSTEEQGTLEARAQHEAGFDYIKVYNNLPVPAYRGLIEEGRRLGIPVLGHVPIQVGLENALKWGQTGIEHLRGSIQVLVKDNAPVQPSNDLRSRMLAWQYVDTARMDELVELTAKHDVYHCPTVIARLFFSPSPRVTAYLDRPESVFIQPRWRSILENRRATKWLSNFSEADFSAAAAGFKQMDAYILALHEAGIPLLAGTDMGPWGFSLHDELLGLVSAGLSPAEVLRTATINPARFSQLEGQMGAVEIGNTADLVVLNANPLEDIRNTRKIHAVLHRGRVMDREYLDQRLRILESEHRSLR